MECGVRSLESGVWSLESGVWSLESGVWSLESGVWSLESGVWSLESGVFILKYIGINTLLDSDRTLNSLTFPNQKHSSPTLHHFCLFYHLAYCE